MKLKEALVSGKEKWEGLSQVTRSGFELLVHDDISASSCRLCDIYLGKVDKICPLNASQEYDCRGDCCREWKVASNLFARRLDYDTHKSFMVAARQVVIRIEEEIDKLEQGE